MLLANSRNEIFLENEIGWCGRGWLASTFALLLYLSHISFFTLLISSYLFDCIWACPSTKYYRIFFFFRQFSIKISRINIFKCSILNYPITRQNIFLINILFTEIIISVFFKNIFWSNTFIFCRI